MDNTYETISGTSEFPISYGERFILSEDNVNEVNLPCAFRIHCEIDTDKLEQAIKFVIGEMDAMRLVIVKKGDEVLIGQLIAEASGFISANVHASVSGTVKKIEPRLLANGNKCDCIIIENDCIFKESNYEKPKPLDELSREEIVDLVKKAGVVGMGGAGFPTNVKLSPKEPDKIDYVIVNGSECEPYLTSDYRRLIEDPEDLILGLKCIALPINPSASRHC